MMAVTKMKAPTQAPMTALIAIGFVVLDAAIVVGTPTSDEDPKWLVEVDILGVDVMEGVSIPVSVLLSAESYTSVESENLTLVAVLPEFSMPVAVGTSRGSALRKRR
jgi:hypothetical protein